MKVDIMLKLIKDKITYRLGSRTFWAEHAFNNKEKSYFQGYAQACKDILSDVEYQQKVFDKRNNPYTFKLKK